jgi:hypothetical protein
MSNDNDEALQQQINALKPGGRLKAFLELEYIAELEFTRHESGEEFTGRVKGLFDKKTGEPVPAAEDAFKRHDNQFRRIKRSKIISVS